VLADNPQLTVRLVNGKNPQPIILDTYLRIPLESKLIQRSDVSVWIVSGQTNTTENVERLRRVGATILPCKTTEDGKIDLFALMTLLVDMEINSMMVEGGAKVITSFIEAKLVDQFVITITPKLLNGLQVIENAKLIRTHCLKLEHVDYERLGADLILWARPVWEEPCNESQ
jgi:GTP cyclohydrolase II